MELTYWNKLSSLEQTNILMRPAAINYTKINQSVSAILDEVKAKGDAALKALTEQFDKVKLDNIKLSSDAIKSAATAVDPKLKKAIELASSNIEKFHQAQKMKAVKVETMPGVICEQISVPIQSVGLYIPGGTAPLLSTVLMLAIPAKIAECKKVVLCSPPPISNEIIYAACCCGIEEIYQVGGAQAIAAMAFGTQTITKVNKIFGPGNSYVTEAKKLVSQRSDGAAIDMPAGPSEVLVIADSQADPEFVAADLLSQAEHGPDSQVILLTPDENLARDVMTEITDQLATLSRAEIAITCLKSSRFIVTNDINQCVEISNQYGPEHLIIQTSNAREIAGLIFNAGSVFIGAWSPESAGDYASGTNHVLPTYGYTSTYSSLGLADFQKRMTLQELSPEGLSQIGEAIELLAQAEQLTAHKNAVTVRLTKLKKAKV